MRNILVFPDGNKQDFMYPADRKISLGQKIQVQMNDNSIHVLSIVCIEPKDLGTVPTIYYYLDHS
ncbi:hypothetical protein LAV82_23380 [Bacillus sp. ILBB4]|nr:hypothetical protein [Bacillus sp. ILBB4]